MTFGTNIAKAIVAAQSEMTDATKEAKNPFFKSKYADLNSVREAIMPALTKNKCAVLQPVILLETGRSVVRTTVLHESGEFYSADTEVVCSKINDAQAYGSAISYARRYGLQSMFNVGAVDDDAESNMGRSQSAAKSLAKVEAAPKAPVAKPEVAQETKSVAPEAPKPKPFQRTKPVVAPVAQEDDGL